MGSLPEQMISEWEQVCSANSSARVNVGKMLDYATLDIICDGNYGFLLLFSTLNDWIKSSAALGLPVNTVQNPNHPLARTHLEIL
jgi:hypothetical protein